MLKLRISVDWKQSRKSNDSAFTKLGDEDMFNSSDKPESYIYTL